MGVEVITPVMEKACRDLNKRFFTFHERKRPFVILKWAQSRDGFIFPDKGTVKKGAPFWISNNYSLQRVHQWRAEEAAILVGKNTVLQDDPKLNIRHYTGNSILRIVIDRRLELPQNLNFFDNSEETIVYNEKKEESQGSLKFVKLDFSEDVIGQIMKHLHSLEIQSLIVEGGAYTLNSFLKADVWDEARVFEGEPFFQSGIKAPLIEGTPKRSESLLEDKIMKFTRVEDGK